ncbi:MAG: glycosyltransferase family 2 protein [Rhizobacter sp.]|nr:glycosyltransferase family 2 protein [Chlorobiales bacterium]
MLYAVVPCYNAEPHLPELLPRLKKIIPPDRIIAIDDGSTDRTASLLRQSGVQVSSHPTNLGKGRSLRTGYEAALRQGALQVLSLDSDLQHAPEDIPNLLAVNADLVIGSRRRAFAPTVLRPAPTPMPLLRRLSNRITSELVSLLVRQPVLDSQCGFRLASRGCIEAVLPKCKETGFMFETEFLLVAAAAGFTIGSAEIETRYAGEKSYMRPFSETVKFLKLIFHFATYQR